MNKIVVLSLLMNIASLVMLLLTCEECFNFQSNYYRYGATKKNLFCQLIQSSLFISVVIIAIYTITTKSFGSNLNGAELFAIGAIGVILSSVLWILSRDDIDSPKVLGGFIAVILSVPSMILCIIGVPFFFFVNFTIIQIVSYCAYLFIWSTIFFTLTCMLNYIDLKWLKSR